jgi:hypothetical protein
MYVPLPSHEMTCPVLEMFKSVVVYLYLHEPRALDVYAPLLR